MPGGPCPPPSEFVEIKNRTEGQMDNLLLAAPQILGASTALISNRHLSVATKSKIDEFIGLEKSCNIYYNR